MMSNIQIKSTRQAMILYCDYKVILQKKIECVCQKIGFDDSKVVWIVYDPRAEKKTEKTTIAKMHIDLNGKDYGYCIPQQNQICISTLSIQKEYSVLKKYNNIIGMKKEADDFLAYVIIDEITHFQTESNHGNKKYDDKFLDNLQKYYLSPFDRAMQRIK